MLKIYNTNHDYIISIDKCASLQEVIDLETGMKSIAFKLPLTEELLAAIDEEGYIETADYSYVIKEIEKKTNSFFNVYGRANVEDLEYTIIPVFDCLKKSPEEAFQMAVSAVTINTWTLEYNCPEFKTEQTYQLQNTSAFEMIEKMKEDNGLEIFYDTKNRIVKVYAKMGNYKGTVVTNQIKLKKLVKNSNTYEFATVLYPIGKDGLTIADINNGIRYIENFTYCNKYLPKFWIQKDIEVAEILKMKAEEYLEKISKPEASYEVDLLELPPNLNLGDNLIFIDNIKKTKDRQRIVKITHYPFEPERDKVELDNKFFDMKALFDVYTSPIQKQINYVEKNLENLE